MLFLFFLLSQAIPSNYLTVKCQVSTSNQFYIVATGPVPYPICLAKGLSLKVVSVNGQATLDVDWSQLKFPSLMDSSEFQSKQDMIINPLNQIYAFQDSVDPNAFVAKANVDQLKDGMFFWVRFNAPSANPRLELNTFGSKPIVDLTGTIITNKWYLIVYNTLIVPSGAWEIR